MIKINTDNLFKWLIISVIVFPYARFFLFGIPIYTANIFTLLLLFKVKFNKDLKPYFTSLILFFFVLTIYHIIYSGTFLILFNNFNRFLSVIILFLFSSYLCQDISSREKVLNAIEIGFKLCLILFFIQILLFYFFKDFLQIYYQVIYKFISSSEKFYERLDVVLSEGFVLRFAGTYHNPNSFAMLVVLMLTIFYFFSKEYKVKSLLLITSILSILLTGSKQGIICLIFLFVVNYKTFSKAFIKYFLLVLTAFILLYNKLDLSRFTNVSDFSNSADERSWGYENFLNFIESDFLSFLFGTGINVLSLRHYNLNIENPGFVSNSFLLIFSFIGLIGFLFMVFFCIKFINLRKMYPLFILLIIYSLFDNHFAILESFQIIVFLIFSLALHESKKKYSFYR